MRILHVINGLTSGGAETVLYRLTTYPSDVHHEVICLERSAIYSRRLEAKGIPVHHLNWTSVASSPGAWLRLRRLIRGADADLVQTWMYRSNILGGIAAKRANLPVVWNIRGSSVEPLRLRSRILARAGGLLAGSVPSRIVNCSAASVELHERMGYDPAKVIVVPNGYDSDAFFPDEDRRAAVRKRLRVDPDVFLIGSIGRWHSAKSYPTLVEAIRLLVARGLDLRLVLIGPGMDASNAELAGILRRSGCESFVQLLGYRDDVADVARALDLHVLASVTEGFPNVVAETMLSGTPNVATDVGDSAAIVGRTGWVVPPGNAEALSDATVNARAEWSGSPEQWRKRQSAARRHIADNFGLGKMVDAYQKIWANAAHGGGLPKVNVNSRPSGNEGIRLRTTSKAKKLESTSGDAKAELAAERPLRILHIINDLTLGGAETLLFRVVTSDSANEHRVVSLGKAAWYSPRFQEEGIEVQHLDMDSVASVPGALARLSRIVRGSSADVVHCWMYRSNVFGGVVAKAARKPVVWGIHCSSIDALRPSSRALARLSGVLARWTPDFVINCSTQSAELHRRIGYSAAAGAVVHNGYDASAFFPDEEARRRQRAALGLSAADFAIGSISRWDSLKDIPNLLEALRLVADRGVQFRCFLIGSGLSEDNVELQREIQRRGCVGLIQPLGRRNDIEDLARALDLHVLASRTEAFPSVVAETMLSGTPNVVTDVGDASVMIGGTGWPVPARNPGKLADAIVEAHREWSNDPDRWNERRGAGRQRIAENFSFDSMLRAYERLWAEVAQR